MNKRAIIIGATGVVGRELVLKLDELESLSEIVIFTRRKVDYNSPKIINYIIDFDNIHDCQELVNGEYFFSCLGTTKALAGSIEAQRKVDLDYQLEFAKLAAKNGIHHYALVSSPGANSNSSNAYLKMKGELDDQVKTLDFQSICLFKPSLIDGNRTDSRPGERIGIMLSSLFQHIPGLNKYKKITGEEIAKKMVHEVFKNPRGFKEFQLDELFTLE